MAAEPAAERATDREGEAAGDAAPSRQWLGMTLCAASMAVFALQDAITRTLVSASQPVAPVQIMTVRLWVFAFGAVCYAAWRGRLARAFRPTQPRVQFVRAALSACEMVTVAWALKFLGLAETHALFASFPLMAVVMAGPVLGERLDARRVLAVIAGFLGALLIIRPAGEFFRPGALLALAAAAMFAGYQVTGRLAARHDDFLTSVVQISVIGALLLTPWGLLAWRVVTPAQWTGILAVSLLAIIAHLLLVRALEFAEAGQLQPFNYFLLLFALLIGTAWFGERPPLTSWIGATLIVGAGLWTIMGERRGHTAI